MRLQIVSVALLAAAGVASAELKERQLCGAFPGRGALEQAKHRDLAERRGASTPGRALAASPAVEIEGDLVLVADDGQIVSEANPFDLRERTLVYSPRGPSTYAFRSEPGGVEPGIGSRIGIGDDVTRSYDLAFEFPFFGERYRRLFLNSDGNITFVRGDAASTERSLERFLTGPPRAALFFADLDPTEVGDVLVANLPDRFVATWDGVPEWGEDAPNTFQIELSPDGTLRMRYGFAVNAASGIAGLSPGGSSEEVNLVDLGGEPREVEGAMGERFQRGRMIDNVALAQSVYRALPDRYDSIVAWTNFESDLDDAFAFSLLVHNEVAGIGEEDFDNSRAWGSEGELESFVFMGNLRRYPRDPRGRVLGAASRPTTLGLLAHEIGHRWLARALVRRSGIATDALLGRQSSHWSFFLDTDASFLEGNDIVQESESRFRTVETVARYSRLDLYLMGLADASEVEPFFLVTGASPPSGEPVDAESTPRTGVVIDGSRVDVTIDDVIRALGPREPSADAAPTSFRHAWVLLSLRSGPPTSADVAQIQDARNAFLAFFQEQTLGRAQIDVAIERR
jgi:hypothetical protein